MANLFRSLVFVPGNNPRFLEKAKSLPADIVCFDLEDSVPDKEKKKARALIKNTLKQRSKYSPDVFVRTNSPESGIVEADLKEIVQKGIDGALLLRVFQEEGVNWFALARDVAKEKFGNKRAVDNREISKRMRFLQHRGFDFDQIKYAISSSADQ